MTLRIGIIACGMVTEAIHLPAYSKVKGIKVVAACDPDIPRAERLAKMYNIPKLYKTYEELLANEELDAVSVNSPHKFHAQHTVASLKKGCHVLVEKPMALSAKEIRAMIAAAKRAGKLLMVEHPVRFFPACYKARQILTSGRLGKILTIRGRFGHAGPENWSPTGQWFMQKKESQGGCMLDIGVHEIDMIRYVSGKEVKEVSAYFATIEKKIDVEDNAVCLLRFDDGTIGTFESSWTCVPGVARTEFYCERGHLILDLKAEDPLLIEKPKGQPWSVKLPKRHPDLNAMAYFVKCILKGLTPHCAADYAAGSTEVVLAAAVSAARGGRAMKLPLR